MNPQHQQLQRLLQLPLGKIRLKRGDITGPPPVIARPLTRAALPVEATARHSLTQVDGFEHRAVARTSAAKVVDCGGARIPMECLARADHVGPVDIVSNLFRVIAEDPAGGTEVTKMTCSRRECRTMFIEEPPWLSEEDKSRAIGEGIRA